MFLAGVAACAGPPPEAAPDLRPESPADEILRVGGVWQTTYERRGFESEPSPVALFTQRVESTLDLSSDAATPSETLKVQESFELRDGRRFECRASALVKVGVRFGRKAGEAAVEVTRPSVALDRTCRPPGAPVELVSVPSGPARFVLRSDRLVAFDPPLEKRIYLPIR